MLREKCRLKAQRDTLPPSCPPLPLYGITTFYITPPSLDGINCTQEELTHGSKEDCEMARDGDRVSRVVAQRWTQRQTRDRQDAGRGGPLGPG